MGAKTVDTSSTNQTSNHNSFKPDPQASAAYSSALSNAQSIASNPYQIAPFNATQQQATGTLGNAPGALGNATASMTAGANALQPGNFASNIGQYLNPYTNNVINTTMANINQQNQLQDQGAIGQSIRAGNAFGGDRMGLGLAALGNQQALASDQTIAGLRSAGYNQATGVAEAAAQNQLAAGTGMVGAENSQITAANSQLAAGTLQQQTSQAQLAAPYTQASWLSGIDVGVGSAMGNNSWSNGTAAGTQSVPNGNLGSEIIGAGLVGSSLASSGAFTGLGAALAALKTGGRVSYAAGGQIPSIDATVPSWDTLEAPSFQAQAPKNLAQPYNPQTATMQQLQAMEGSNILTPGNISSTMNAGLKINDGISDATQNAAFMQDAGLSSLKRGGRVDIAIPESLETLKAQQRELISGKRAVMMFKSGSHVLPMPDGMKEANIGPDTVHFDPKKIGLSEIHSAIENDKIGELLRLGPVSKNDAISRVLRGDHPTSVVERDPRGTEIRAAAGTLGTANEQLRHMHATKGRDNVVSLEHPNSVIARRGAQMNRGGVVGSFADGGSPWGDIGLLDGQTASGGTFGDPLNFPFSNDNFASVPNQATGTLGSSPISPIVGNVNPITAAAADQSPVAPIPSPDSGTLGSNYTGYGGMPAPPNSVQALRDAANAQPTWEGAAPFSIGADNLSYGYKGAPSPANAGQVGDLGGAAMPAPASSLLAGVDPNARGMKNNNPGNLESNAWTQSLPGYAGTDGRFAKFDTPEQGVSALDRNLQGYGAKGINTPASIISTWSPPGESPANKAAYPNYVQALANKLGIGQNDPIDLSDPAQRANVATAIAQFENGMADGTTATAYAPPGQSGTAPAALASVNNPAVSSPPQAGLSAGPIGPVAQSGTLGTPAVPSVNGSGAAPAYAIASGQRGSLGTASPSAASGSQSAVSGKLGSLASAVSPNKEAVPGGSPMLDSLGIHLTPEMRTALMTAGFGMMASRSPFLGQAIGEGGLAGVQQYTKQQQLGLQTQKTAAETALQGAQTKEINFKLGLQQAAMKDGFGATPQEGADNLSKEITKNATTIKSGTEPAPDGAVAPAASQANAAPQKQVVQQDDPNWLLQQALAEDQRAQKLQIAGFPATSSINAANNYRLRAASIQKMDQTVRFSDGTAGYYPPSVQASTELEAKKATAAEVAKAPFEMVQVQREPGGPTELVPKSSILGKSGVTPIAPGAGTPPGSNVDAAAAANPIITKQPEFYAEKQKAIAADETAMIDQYQARQISRQRIGALIGVMQNYQPGALAEEKASIVATLRGVGIPIGNSDTANPAEFEKFTKNATANVFSDMKAQGGKQMVAEITGLTRANANPELQPEAAAAILGQGLGLINYEDQHTKDYFDWKHKPENRNSVDTSTFELPWLDSHPASAFVDAADKAIAYKGQTIPPPQQRVTGQTYMTPKGAAVWQGNGWQLKASP